MLSIELLFVQGPQLVGRVLLLMVAFERPKHDRWGFVPSEHRFDLEEELFFFLDVLIHRVFAVLQLEVIRATLENALSFSFLLGELNVFLDPNLAWSDNLIEASLVLAACSRAQIVPLGGFHLFPRPNQLLSMLLELSLFSI